MKIKASYDVIIIGSGPSGTACAIRCAELGLKSLCIDNIQNNTNKTISPGLFTNGEGLATIALLESAKLYVSLLTDINLHGISVENMSFDLRQMIQRKDNLVNKVNQRVTDQFSEKKIDFIHAKGKLLNPHTVEIDPPLSLKRNKISAKHIVLASESIPISIPCAPVDNEFILDSMEALNLKTVPKRLGILGAGVIGLELAGIWNRLGAETILLDAQDTFLNLTDHQISREAYKIFTDQGLELRLGTRVISTKIINKKVLVEYQDSDGTHAIKVDKLFVASGRKPNSNRLAAPEANLLLNENGFVHVNENFRTNLPNVYAIGDLTLFGPMLAHKGIAEGIHVAEQIAGVLSSPVDYNLIPNVIYTLPEIAWVGQTEQAIKSLGDPIKTGMVSLNYNPKAICTDKEKGLIKIISCARTDTILGIHILAHNASELIGEAALAMQFSANSEDISNTIHPFPSFVDFIRQASNYINDSK